MREIIEGIYESLPRSERKVADYILENPEDAIHHSITELAGIIRVGEATIHRFVKRLGFDGFQSFKIELARELSEKDLSSGDPLDELVEELESVVSSVKKLVPRENIEKAVDMIVESERIIFFGVGLSGVTAHYGSVKFSMLRLPSFYYNDPHLQVVVAVNLTPRDLLISVSHTWNIIDTVKSTRVAKDVGAKTIVITSGIGSPLSKLGDVVLYTKIPKSNIHYFMRGNIGEMVMVEVLFRLTLSRLEKMKKGDFSDVSEVLKPKRY